MATGYTRPVLCRLCRFPAPDGGVPVSEVDREKLSEWCLRMMDTELDQEGLGKAVFCQFCVSDARFEIIHSQEDNNHWLDSGYKDYNWDKHLTGDLIQPCAVLIKDILAEKADNPQGKHKCSRCTLRFHSTEARGNHIRRCQSRTIHKLRCRSCRISFESEFEKLKHRQEHHPVICFYCNATFDSSHERRAHLMKFHKGRVFQCTYINNCALFFWTQSELDFHTKQVHQNDEGKKQCVYCKKFVGGMFSHVNKQHKKEAIKCNYVQNCGVYFLSKEERQVHVQEVHEDSGKKSIACLYCKKKMHPQTMVRHMKNYHQSEVIKCNYVKKCGSYFVHKDELQQHIEKVHKSVFFQHLKCIYCNRVCDSKKGLTIHVRQVHFDLEVKCRWRGCVEFFHTEEEEKKHFDRTHREKEQLKPFQCDKCGLRVTNSKTLQVHVLRRHSAPSIKCPHCSKMVPSPCDLKRHLKKEHEGERNSRCENCDRLVVTLREHQQKKNCKGCGHVSLCIGENLKHVKNCKLRKKLPR